MPIHKKLLNIMSKIERVPKNGFNAFHKYKFVQDTDLTEYVRNFLVEEGVAVMPSIESQTVMPQGDNYLTLVDGSITFVDTEDGSSVVVKCQGQGQDKGDKGVYKAMTGFMKYGMMKVFMVPTGDDPEHDEEPKPAKSQKPAAKPNVAPISKPPQPTTQTRTGVNWSAFWSETRKLGFDRDDVHTAAGVESIQGWTQEQIDALLTTLREKKEGAA